MTTPARVPTVVLLTVSNTEYEAVLAAFGKAPAGVPSQYDANEDLRYWELGTVSGVRAVLVQSQQATSSVGGSQQTVEKAIRVHGPSAVIAVGIAYGLQRAKGQKLGHVLLSDKIECYEHQRVQPGADGQEQHLHRGDRVSAPPRLLDAFKDGARRSLGRRWQSGLIVSADKLVDWAPYCQQVLSHAPEALGGEMESTGVYVSATSHGVDWIVVKGISDWGTEKGAVSRRAAAAKNAAELVHYVMAEGLLAQVYAGQRPALVMSADELSSSFLELVQHQGRSRDCIPIDRRWLEDGGQRVGSPVPGPGPSHAGVVWVRAGAFDAGWDGDPPGPCADDRAPRRPVVTDPGFWLQRYLVTNAQYAEFLCDLIRAGVDVRGCSVWRSHQREIAMDEDALDPCYAWPGREDHPVVGVDWYGARAYAWRYWMRLPTEDEWEYAARGSCNHVYPWGLGWDARNICSRDNPGRPWNYRDHVYADELCPAVEPLPGAYRLDGPEREGPLTQTVACSLAGDAPKRWLDRESWCHAVDMAGNLLEWCADEPDGGYLTVRGGNYWHGNAHECAAYCRCFPAPPVYNKHSVGFRCVVHREAARELLQPRSAATR